MTEFLKISGLEDSSHPPPFVYLLSLLVNLGKPGEIAHDRFKSQETVSIYPLLLHSYNLFTGAAETLYSPVKIIFIYLFIAEKHPLVKPYLT